MELSSPASSLLYAIGDVHGRADLLSALLAFVAEDSADRCGEPKIVFLGDIVDRGPDSRSAMDLVVDALDRWSQSRLMLGNHDQWFLNFLDGAEPDQKWLAQGGIATLGSYGLLDDEPDYIRSSILTHHPNHARALREASVIEFDGEFAFVHAGINPLQALDQQEPRDCLWIRKPFLDHIGRCSHVVVHGHSPM